MKKIHYILFALVLACNLKLNAEFLDKGTIILGRPTTNSITASVLAKSSLEFYIEYGKISGSYPNKTANFTSTYPEPIEFVINNLDANKRYYYRIQYRENQSQSFVPSDEYYFQTQRAKGSTFSFTIEADPHLYDKKGCGSLMEVSMKNQAKDSADFILDLGDTFGDDHNPTTITDAQVKQLHLNYLPYFGMLCHSSPLFLCIGNHEGESGYYLLQTPPNNLATYGTKWRTKYYPNPFPDGFYSGNTDVEGNGIGRPQNYYAFEWGDALFVIMDVYRYYTANAKPQKWDWTIGDNQYQWFKNTLENSAAKYKFVFAHHTLGQGRGGAKTAMLYEWGGYEDTAKTKYTFAKNRPTWAKPIHQLMVDNVVNIFFQGHDHLFAKESVDGIVYQEVPIPCDSTYEIGYLANADAYTELNLDGAGYMRVTVSEPEIKVDYVKSYLPKDETDSLKNGMVGYSYKVNNSPNSAGDELAVNKNIFKLSPNPASDFIEIEPMAFTSLNILNLSIYNALGEQVMNLDGAISNKIDISNLQSGAYTLIIKTQENRFIEKFVLVK